MQKKSLQNLDAANVGAAKVFLELKPSKVDVKSRFYIPFERALKELSNGMSNDFLSAL